MDDFRPRFYLPKFNYMAYLKKGLLGPVTGKVGTLVGSSWRGIEFVKSLPNRTKPPTPGELANRHIFKFTQQWLTPIDSFLKVGFKGYSQTSYGVNAAKSYLYKHALKKDGFNSSIDPSLMLVSYGNLSLSDNIQMELIENDQLSISWNPKILKGQDPDDQVMIVAYNIEKKIAIATASGQFRKTGQHILDLEGLADGTIHIYVAFISVDRESQSNSVYLGTVFIEPRPQVKKKLEKGEDTREVEI